MLVLNFFIQFRIGSRTSFVFKDSSIRSFKNFKSAYVLLGYAKQVNEMSTIFSNLTLNSSIFRDVIIFSCTWMRWTKSMKNQFSAYECFMLQLALSLNSCSNSAVPSLECCIFMCWLIIKPIKLSNFYPNPPQ